MRWKNSLIQKSKNDPVWWIENVLGDRLWDKQKEICMSVKNNERTACPAAFGLGKCVEENELIPLADGSVIKAKNLVGTNFKLLAFDEQCKRIVASEGLAEVNGTRLVYKLKLKSGRIFKRTVEHPFYIKFEGRWQFMPILNIVCGDKILVPVKSRLPKDFFGKIKEFLFRLKAKEIFDGFVEDEVVEVKPVGEFNTISIEVPKYHTFITDAIEHNTFIASRLALWFLYNHYPSRVISTAPCFDDQTEILTDQGWKFFKDLDKTEKVASLEEGEMKFVEPSDWMDYYVEGEMIGYKDLFVDFLITPHHKCYVNYENKWQLIKAENLYGKDDFSFNITEGDQKEFDDFGEKAHIVKANKSKWYKKEYLGHVYCVTVPSHIVFVRRGGVAHWSGQTSRQVKDLLWSEIRAAHSKSKIPLGGEVLQLSLKIDDEQFAVGFSTDDSNIDMFTGYHAPNQLVIFDQAGGLSQVFYEGAEGLMTSKNCRWLAISNTAISDCEFANICMPERKSKHGTWNIIPITAFDSPNVKAGRDIFPGLISNDWIAQRTKAWGKDDPLYRIFVKAEFVPSIQMNVIPYQFLLKGYELKGVMTEDDIQIGVDVARTGLDSTVWVARCGQKALELRRTTGNDTMIVSGMTIEFVKYLEEKYEKPVSIIKIDTIGLGAGVYDRLSEQDYPVLAINNSEVKIVVDSERYLNVRAEMAWALRYRFEHGDIALGDINFNGEDELMDYLKGDLQVMKYKITSSGKIQILTKDEIKKELGRSPDYWDALVMAFEQPGGGPAVAEYISAALDKISKKQLISDEDWKRLLGINVDPEDPTFNDLDIGT